MDLTKTRIYLLPRVPGNVVGTDSFVLERQVSPGIFVSFRTPKSNIVYHSSEVVGGYHQVETTDDRDAIEISLRVPGMTCWVNELGKVYRLVGGVENTNWVEATDSDITAANQLTGGYHVVENVTARDAIPAPLRLEGMLAFCVSEQQTYRLIGGTANSNWELQSISGINANDVIGGYHVVADVTARDAIADAVRQEGMLAYVISSGVTYRLQGGLTNSDWVDTYIGSTPPSATNAGILTFNTVDDARLQEGDLTGNRIAFVFGQDAIGDIGQTRIYRWDATETAVDDGVNVIAPLNLAMGRWMLIL